MLLFNWSLKLGEKTRHDMKEAELHYILVSGAKKGM